MLKHYGKETQHAIDNFPISGLMLPMNFIYALAQIKSAAAQSNEALGLLDPTISKAIQQACQAIRDGQHADQFPVDVFQTGSGTSTNMNINEVVASLATHQIQRMVHPNDHVNQSQSSNDIIPCAIHLSASLAIQKQLIPALQHLYQQIDHRSKELNHITKTGRTHLMDAMPLTLGQELSGWAAQIKHTLDTLNLPLRIHSLAIGGTAVGTGINAPREFGPKVASLLSEQTGIHFECSTNYFEALSSQNAAVELSGDLKILALSLLKISNDLRWMNSGPLSGLGEITLPALQAGSSIMPGKINPVIPEAVSMVCAQVIGNDASITVAGQSGNFQLNMMLPLIAYNLLQSIQCLSNAMQVLADKAIMGFTVNEAHIKTQLAKNPILVTALNRVLGYELSANIAKTAYKTQEPLIEVALKMSTLSRDELQQLLDPNRLTQPGIP